MANKSRDDIPRNVSQLRPVLENRLFSWSEQALWMWCLTLVLLFGKMLPASRFSVSPGIFLALHAFTEFIAIAVSAMVFSLAWNLRGQGDNSHRTILGAGFLAVALIDFVHVLSFDGMPALLTPSSPEKAINFWLAGRFVAAAVLLAVAVLPVRRWSSMSCYASTALAMAFSAIVWWVGIGHAEWMPRTFVAGVGLTAFKIYAEYLLAAAYGLAAILLCINGRRSRNSDLLWLAVAAWAQGLAEIFLTLYASVTDIFNLLGHLYKTIAYVMVFRALFVNGVKRPYLDLELERARLKALVTAIPDLIWLKDINGVFLNCNQAFERFVGAKEVQIVGRTDHDFVDTKLVDFFRKNDHAAMTGGEPVHNEEWLSFAADGYHGLFQTSNIPLYAADGRVVSVVGIAHDITEQRSSELALRESEQRFKFFHDASFGGVLIHENGKILECNQALAEMTGYSLEELIGMEGYPFAALNSLSTILRNISSGYEHPYDVEGVRKDGSLFPLSIQGKNIPYKGRIVRVTEFRDITERKLAEEKIHRLAFYDPLTGLPNRQLLCDRVGHALVTRSRHQCDGAVLFVDIDHFQRINDTLGRESGDLLLQQVSQRLISSLREGDTVARVGGDQFIILLEGLSDDQDLAKGHVESIAEKIVARFHEGYLLAGALAQCTVCIGVAMFDTEQETEALLSRAQLAMNEAKSAEGQHICFFDPQMQALVIAKASMEADLRQALPNDQFLLYYQVQVDSSGRPVGAEALLRWNHPERGFVSPAEFIPMAENNGLILPIGKWVLETACRQLAAWASQPGMATLTLAVNVSARQFHHGNFVTQVLDVLETTKANPRRLKLELTEGLLLNDVEGVIAKMTSLKEHGISFSLDDFGTGYSSLSYLKRLPLDQLKIDQSFVRDVLSNPEDAAIARTIIALGQSLELNVIAEGVETGDQRDFLASNGCLNYQGYLFGRPLRLEEFDQLVQRV